MFNWFHGNKKIFDLIKTIIFDFSEQPQSDKPALNCSKQSKQIYISSVNILQRSKEELQLIIFYEVIKYLFNFLWIL